MVFVIAQGEFDSEDDERIESNAPLLVGNCER